MIVREGFEKEVSCLEYSVVLIDDESWALVGMEKSFAWDRYGFRVTLKETSATRALKYILEERPDAVFTDIRMNNMSGLELIRAVREAGLDTEFVIISGYSDFHYAQTAIQDGVFQYLLKPLDIAETNSLLLSLVKRLREKRGALSSLDWVEDIRHSNETIRDYCEARELRPGHPAFLVATLGCADVPGAWSRRPDLQVLDSVRLGRKKCVSLLCLEPDALEGVLAGIDADVSAGFSSIAAPEDALYAMYRESDVAYVQQLFLGAPGVCRYRRESARETAQAAARLMSVFAAGTPEDILAAMQECRETLSRHELTVEYLALLYNQILTGLWANRHYNFPADVKTLDYRGIQALFHSGEDFFRFLDDLVSPQRFEDGAYSERDRQQMEQILAYIQENYAKPLYLSDLSQRFFLSQTSICALFRRNMKTSFMNYLTALRMNRAAELLTATEMNLIDVAESVGYRDQYYFSRMFKKQTGLTPQQYRDLNASADKRRAIEP